MRAGGIEDAGMDLGGLRRPGPLTSGEEADFLYRVWPKPDFRTAARSGRTTPERAALYMAVYANLAPRPAPVIVGGIDLDWPTLWRRSIETLRLMWEEGACSTLESMMEVHDAMMARHFPDPAVGELARFGSGRQAKGGVRHGLSLSPHNGLRMKWLPRMGWPHEPLLKDDDGLGVMTGIDGGVRFYQPVRTAPGRIDPIGDRVKHPTEEAAEAELRRVVEGIFAERRRDAAIGTGRKALGRESVRVGPPNPRRAGRPATTADFVEVMGMRGVEFGDFIGQRERQAVLDEAFDAFFDLCTVLRLPAAGASFWGRAGIAFGSRGLGANVSGHFDPGLWIVHMDRSFGAGVLAHEMGHALDAVMAEASGLRRGLLLTEAVAEGWVRNDVAGLMKELIDEMRVGEVGGESEFLLSARRLDRGPQAYWQMPAELFARLFESWVSDALERIGRRNDFLVKREAGSEPVAGREWHRADSPYPRRLERERMVRRMDAFVKAAVPLAQRVLGRE